MAEKTIYQHHERTTTAALEADLYLREIGIDPVLKMLTAYSEVLATRIHAVTQESPAVQFAGTLGVTGATALAALSTSGLATLNSLAVSGTATHTPLVGTGIRLVTATAAGVLGNATTIVGAYTWSGVQTFTAAPVFSSATASLPMFTDGSKGLVSNTMTGTGSVMMSVSPASTGTASFVNSTNSGTLNVTGQVIGSSSVRVTGANVTGFTGEGLEIDFGALASTGHIFAYHRTSLVYLPLRLGQNLDITAAGDIAINTNKFTVAAASGNTLVAGTLGVTGAITGSNLSGTNTGDQTITLTGGVTGSGTGSFAATVITNANLTGDVTSVGNTTTLTNAPVIAKVLTGYVSGAGTVASGDSILQAIQKLNGNNATNANLTGPITSVGNATSVASQTGTGSTFAMSAGPAFTGTATFVNTSNSGTLNVTGQVIGSSSVRATGSNATGFTGNGLEIDYGAISNTGRVFAYNRTADVFLPFRVGPNLDIAVAGDIAINTNKFTVAAASGNTLVAGTLGVTGGTSLTGTVGIGLANNSSQALGVSHPGLAGTSQYGIVSQSILTSAATADGTAVYAILKTAAAAFTMTNGYGVLIDVATKGAGSTITNNYGLKVENQTAGTNNWAIYTGTGQVRLGGAVTMASTLDVTGTMTGVAANFSGVITAASTSPSAGIKMSILNNDGVANGEHFVAEFEHSSSTGQLLLGYRANGTATTGPLIRAGNNQSLFFGTSSSNQALVIADSGAITAASTLTVTGLVTASANLVVQGNYIKLPLLSSHPASPAQGWMYFNTTSAHGVLYNGSTWIEFA